MKQRRVAVIQEHRSGSLPAGSSSKFVERADSGVGLSVSGERPGVQLWELTIDPKVDRTAARKTVKQTPEGLS